MNDVFYFFDFVDEVVFECVVIGCVDDVYVGVFGCFEVFVGDLDWVVVVGVVVEVDFGVFVYLFGLVVCVGVEGVGLDDCGVKFFF